MNLALDDVRLFDEVIKKNVETGIIFDFVATDQDIRLTKHRKVVGIDDTTINTYESLSDKNNKPFEMKIADKITNIMIVSDFSLQRIIDISM